MNTTHIESHIESPLLTAQIDHERANVPEPMGPESQSDKAKELPVVLMKILDEKMAPDAMWWLPCGKAFAINTGTAPGKILDKYFNGTKLTSFVRQLNNAGFQRSTRHHRKDLGDQLPQEAVTFSHPQFERGNFELLELLRETHREDRKRLGRKTKKPTFIKKEPEQKRVEKTVVAKKAKLAKTRKIESLAKQYPLATPTRASPAPKSSLVASSLQVSKTRIASMRLAAERQTSVKEHLMQISRAAAAEEARSSPLSSYNLDNSRTSSFLASSATASSLDGFSLTNSTSMRRTADQLPSLQASDRISSLLQPGRLSLQSPRYMFPSTTTTTPPSSILGSSLMQRQYESLLFEMAAVEATMIMERRLTMLDRSLYPKNFSPHRSIFDSFSK